MKDRKYYVYTHSLPDGRVFYVGMGSGYRCRKNGGGNRPKEWHDIVAQYFPNGWDKDISVTKVADNLTLNEANALEIECIAKYRKQGHPLVNIKNGGVSCKVINQFGEIFDSISQADETYGGISKHLGRRDIRASCGKKDGMPLFWAKIGDDNIDTIIKRLKEEADNYINPHCRSVINQYGEIFNSIVEAESAYTYGIFQHINGLSKSCGVKDGKPLFWSYYNPSVDNVDTIVTHLKHKADTYTNSTAPKPVMSYIIVDGTEVVIGVYDNINSAYRYTNIDSSSISKAIKGKTQKTAGKYLYTDGKMYGLHWRCK